MHVWERAGEDKHSATCPQAKVLFNPHWLMLSGGFSHSIDRLYKRSMNNTQSLKLKQSIFQVKAFASPSSLFTTFYYRSSLMFQEWVMKSLLGQQRSVPELVLFIFFPLFRRVKCELENHNKAWFNFDQWQCNKYIPNPKYLAWINQKAV